MLQKLKNLIRSKWLRRSLLALGICVILAAGLLLYANMAVSRVSGDVFTSLEQLPEQEVGLVLGTSRLARGKYKNPYFYNRIEAAVALYEAKKIKRIIVSGDNGRVEYNEPEDMRQELLKAGIPDEHITLDYAGFRTLDSVIRAKNVFGADNFTVISQEFHCIRAVYIARENGIDAIGFAAKDVRTKYRIRRFLREPPARLLAWCDINILNRQPHFPK